VTSSFAATLRESATHITEIILPDPFVTYYNNTEGYPNQGFIKHENLDNVDLYAPDYFEKSNDFHKIANEYIKFSNPFLEISNNPKITYGKNYLLVGYHNYQTVNIVPILNSDITITINAETGLIINKSFMVMIKFNEVETSNIININITEKQKYLLEAINNIVNQYELVIRIIFLSLLFFYGNYFHFWNLMLLFFYLFSYSIDSFKIYLNSTNMTIFP